MKQVFVHASIATFLSILVSLGICWMALAAIGSSMGGFFVAKALSVAERLRMAVEAVQFRPHGDKPMRLTVSIGVAAAQTGGDFSQLMGDADKRLYEAKRLGRNMVIGSPEVSAAA